MLYFSGELLFTSGNRATVKMKSSDRQSVFHKVQNTIFQTQNDRSLDRVMLGVLISTAVQMKISAECFFILF